MSWQTVDTNGTPIVRERYWVSFQPGEIRTCVNCHGVNTANQLNQPMPTNKPEALRTFLRWWKVVNLPVTTGRIVFATGRDGNYEIYSMNPDGSAALNLTRTNSTDVIPRVSYDGRKIVFMSDRGQPGYQNVWSMNSDGTGLLNLTKTNLYGSSLWAAAPNFDGSKVIYMGPRTNAGGGYNLYVINGDGTGRTNLTANTGDGNFPYWSYDGSKIVFDSFRDTTTNNSGEEVYIMNANGSGQTRLTFSPGRDFYPVISPDGTKIAFNSERDGHRQIYMMNIDGSNQTNISNTATNVTDNTAYFSPDGKRLSFTSSRDGVGDEVYVMNIDGSGQTRITFNNALDVYPAWGNTASLPSPAVQLQFSAATYSTPVSSNAVTVTVTRAASSTGIVAVAYSTADANAHAGTDYTSTNGLFTWIDGDMTARTFTVVPAADDHLAGPNKTFTVILSNVVNAAIGANSNAIVTLLEAPYDAWKFINFGTNANNATIAGDTANSDADSLVNLFEYALGGDPNLATRGLVPHSAGITFTRNFNASDITLKVEANSNLVTGNWNVIASHSGNSVWVTSPGVTVIDLGLGTVSLTETTNFSSRFYRLQISHP